MFVKYILSYQVFYNMETWWIQRYLMPIANAFWFQFTNRLGFHTIATSTESSAMPLRTFTSDISGGSLTHQPPISVHCGIGRDSDISGLSLLVPLTILVVLVAGVSLFCARRWQRRIDMSRAVDLFAPMSMSTSDSFWERCCSFRYSNKRHFG